MVSCALTSESRPGERISTIGAESGNTSSWSEGGRSPIAPLRPAALQEYVPLDAAVTWPLNARAVTCNGMRTPAVASTTLASSVEE